MRMILKIVSGPFGKLDEAEISRLLYWLQPGDSVRVGRSGFKADMVISADRRMSSGHFTVSCEEEGCFVADMDSTNGTHVNGQQIEEVTTLRDGDEIRAGSTHFAVEILDPTRSSSSLEIDRFAADDYEARRSTASSSPNGLSLDTAPAVSNATASKDSASNDTASKDSASNVTVQFCLEIISGPAATMELHSTQTVAQTWLKPGAPLHVGSDARQAALALEGDLEIAPIHLTLEQRGTVCMLQVCEQCETVRVNNLGMRQGELSGGERITIGQTTILLRREPGFEGAPSQVPPKQAAGPATPWSEAELARHITALSSGQREQVVEALQWFRSATPGETFRDKASQKISTFTRSSDRELSRLAAICYARWSTFKGHATLLQFLESTDPVVLAATFEALLRLGDQNCTQAIAQVLKDPGRREAAKRAIVSSPQVGETIGIRLLLSDDQQVQLVACDMLSQIGTKQSILALQTKLQRSTGAEQEAVQNAAQQALEAVNQRCG